MHIRLVGCIVLLAVIATGLIATSLFIRSTRPLKTYFVGEHEAYKIITTVDSANPGLCAKDKVIRVLDNLLLVTLRICEDNIRYVTQDGDWIIVSTNCNRIYKKNLTTGDDVIMLDQASCFGGGVSTAD